MHFNHILTVHQAELSGHAKNTFRLSSWYIMLTRLADTVSHFMSMVITTLLAFFNHTNGEEGKIKLVRRGKTYGWTISDLYIC